MTNQATAKGAFLDGVVDRYVELLLYLGLLFYLGRGEFLGLPYEAWFMLLFFGSLMTTFVRAYADHRGIVKGEAELKKMGGLLERFERLMLLYAGMFLGLFNTEWLMVVIAITAVLANATALQRIAFAIRHGVEEMKYMWKLEHKAGLDMPKTLEEPEDITESLMRLSAI